MMLRYPINDGKHMVFYTAKSLCSDLHADFLCLQHDALQMGHAAVNVDIVDLVLAAFTKHMTEPRTQKGSQLVSDGVYVQPFTLFLLRVLQVCRPLSVLSFGRAER